MEENVTPHSSRAATLNYFVFRIKLRKDSKECALCGDANRRRLFLRRTLTLTLDLLNPKSLGFNMYVCMYL